MVFDYSVFLFFYILVNLVVFNGAGSVIPRGNEIDLDGQGTMSKF